MRTHADVDVFAALCRRGAVVLFAYGELDGGGQEWELGRVTRSTRYHYEVHWCVLRSTSGCVGLEFDDRYRRGRRPARRARLTRRSLVVRRAQRVGRVFDIDEPHDLTWSSVPIER